MSRGIEPKGMTKGVVRTVFQGNCWFANASCPDCPWTVRHVDAWEYAAIERATDSLAAHKNDCPAHIDGSPSPKEDS